MGLPTGGRRTDLIKKRSYDNPGHMPVAILAVISGLGVI